MGRKIVWHPMPGKVIVRTDGGRRQTEAGIILLKDPSDRIGEVIAVYEPFLLESGDPESETEAYVKPGDMVMFGRHSGVEVTIERERVTVLKEAEILTKFTVEDDDGED